MGDDSNNKTFKRAHELVKRFVEGIIIEGHTSPPTLLELLIAAEIFASMNRRLARDLGVPKTEVKTVMAVASESAAELYEVTGMGSSARRNRKEADEARTVWQPDSSFSGEQWKVAGAAAVEAIKRAKEGKEN